MLAGTFLVVQVDDTRTAPGLTRGIAIRSQHVRRRADIGRMPTIDVIGQRAAAFIQLDPAAQRVAIRLAQGVQQAIGINQLQAGAVFEIADPVLRFAIADDADRFAIDNAVANGQAQQEIEVQLAFPITPEERVFSPAPPFALHRVDQGIERGFLFLVFQIEAQGLGIGARLENPAPAHFQRLAPAHHGRGHGIVADAVADPGYRREAVVEPVAIGRAA